MVKCPILPQANEGGIFASAFRFLTIGGGPRSENGAAAKRAQTLPGEVRRSAATVGVTSEAEGHAGGGARLDTSASANALGEETGADREPPSRLTPSPPAASPESAVASSPSGLSASNPAALVLDGVSSASAASMMRSEDAEIVTASIRGSVRAGGRVWDDDLSASHATPNRIGKFQRLLESESVDVEQLKRLSWSGVPSRYRAAAWQTLLGYLPPTKERQLSSVTKKKLEYQQTVSLYFGRRAGGGMGKSDSEQSLLRQVLVDVPRTNPEIPLFHVDFVQRALERVLYVWAMRHPASGYVQGINDLATPFFAVFLAPWADLDCRDLSHVHAERLAEVEADVYWCLTRLLDGIQDHYTPSQPGIQRMIYRLRELVHRIDEPLVLHLEGNSVEFHQFAFRWCNNLLMRELPFRLVCRLWDTCLTEKDGFEGFYVYICTALLTKFSARLKGMPFQDLVQFLQKLPTKEWTVKDVEELLSQAFIYKTLFEASPSHLNA